VKPSDLGEYEANAMEKQNIQYTRQSTNSPSNQGKSQAPNQNQAIWVANIKFRTQEGSNQDTRFLNAKDHTPPEPMAKHNKCQIQPKTQTPPKVENPKFYQISLDKSEEKHRPLKQQSKSKRI
jgi:hypothetical protein